MSGRAMRQRQVPDRRSNYVALTPPLADALRDLRRQGACYLTCAERLGVNTFIIARWVDELGLPKRLNRGRLAAAKILADRV